MHRAHLDRVVASLQGLSPLMRIDVGYELNTLARKYCDRFTSMHTSRSSVYDNQDLEQVAGAARLFENMAELVLQPQLQLPGASDAENVTSVENRKEKINWVNDEILQWEGDLFAVLLEVKRPNASFRFGVARTHNRIPEYQVAFIQIEKEGEEGLERHTTLLDRSGLIDFQLGFAFVMNEVFRDPGDTGSRPVNAA